MTVLEIISAIKAREKRRRKKKKEKKKGKGHEETQKREAQNSKEALKKQIQKDERCFVFMGLVKLN